MKFKGAAKIATSLHVLFFFNKRQHEGGCIRYDFIETILLVGVGKTGYEGNYDQSIFIARTVKPA